MTPSLPQNKAKTLAFLLVPFMMETWLNTALLCEPTRKDKLGNSMALLVVSVNSLGPGESGEIGEYGWSGDRKDREAPGLALAALVGGLSKHSQGGSWVPSIMAQGYLPARAGSGSSGSLPQSLSVPPGLNVLAQNSRLPRHRELTRL